MLLSASRKAAAHVARGLAVRARRSNDVGQLVFCYHHRLRRPGQRCYPAAPARELSIFRDIAQRVKGEIERNPELKKSIEELKEKTGDITTRTKEQTGQAAQVIQEFKKKIDAAREGAGSRAKLAADTLKGKVSEATEQVKVTAQSLKQQLSEKQHEKVDAASGVGSGDGKAGGEDRAQEESHSSTGAGTSGSSYAEQAKQRVAWAQSKAMDILAKMQETKAVDSIRKGVLFVKDELTRSGRRVEIPRQPTYEGETSSRTEIATVQKKLSPWEARWEKFKQKYMDHPILKKAQVIKQHPVIAKSQEVAEDIRDAWETSDSPVVHKIQDMNETIFGETPQAAAMRVIRERDPYFSLPEFVQDVQRDLKPVLTAYLSGDIQALQKKCSKEVVQRCAAERKAMDYMGVTYLNKLLHISDVEVRETKMVGKDPTIILGFRTQQIYCVKDKHGNIKEGAEDDIHTVYYAWAMQQVPPDEMEEGEMQTRWRLREMQQLGMQAII
ncbi:hypothetical protein CBR_g30902 [Chara braunii]|uniref:Tim44-like domain-containing protein n=1 Tax=Chara braunii TaxID=69332 RepID=A0A388LDR1_CHABU|nr:hypothetical protein CBR_g30902 [Chara braunii]|eukprot:GBG80438.1 hypothetical protein CBR_g30902 [Chara braunii]